MIFSARMIALVLALIAILLLGYAWYSERKISADLQSTIDIQNDQILGLQTEKSERELGFYNYLLSEEGTRQITEIAEAPTLLERRQMALYLSGVLSPYFAEYGKVEEVVSYIENIVSENNAQSRTDIAENLISKVSEAHLSPEPMIMIEENFDKGLGAISSIITILGGAGSAFASAFLFLTNGGRRRIEEDILAVGLEKQRVELAQMKYEAREAIHATQSIQERSEK